MGKFDTHGGYFAPQNYMRINTGGSHEENPNGGVQVGMDAQGIPNMLEEGEPVYDDFVYSDNIIADAEFIEKYKLPKKYVGKLYSEIADDIADEAERRPNDPISNKGLEVMLSRLAQAQEEQKQIAEQKALEEELNSLSPEELAQVQQMMAAQQSPEMAQQTEYPDQQQAIEQSMQVPQEQSQEITSQEIPQMQQMQSPYVMARGGFIRTFEDGTPGTVIQQPPLLLDPNTGNYYVAGATPQQNATVSLPNPEVPIADTEEYNLGIIAPASTSAQLSRDDWDRLYKNGKVDLNSIPIKYRTWIQGNNSELKQRVTDAMDRTGRQIFDAVKTGAEFVAPEVMFPAELAANLAAGNKEGAVIDAIGTLASAGTHIPVQDITTLAVSSPLLRQTKRAISPMGRLIKRGASKIGDKLKKVPEKIVEIKGRQALFNEANTAAKAAKVVSKTANDAAEIANQAYKTAKEALAKDPTNVALQQAFNTAAEALRAADKKAVSATVKNVGTVITSGAKKAGAFTVGPLWNRAGYEKAVDAAKKTLDVAKDALTKDPNNPALKEAVDAAEKVLLKESSNWNKFWNHGEWPIKAGIVGAAVGTGAVTHKNAKLQEEINNQFADGGLINTYSPGGFLDDFVVYLTQDDLENSKKTSAGGWDATNQRWTAHRSPEGGEDTIGHGLKLYAGRPYTKLYNEQGYLTEEQELQFVRQQAQIAQNNARGLYDAEYGQGAFDKLPSQYQIILSDISYQTASPQDFVKLRRAIANNDVAEIEKEIVTNYKTSENGPWIPDNHRYKYKKAVLDSLSTQAPQKVESVIAPASIDYAKDQVNDFYGGTLEPAVINGFDSTYPIGGTAGSKDFGTWPKANIRSDAYHNVGVSVPVAEAESFMGPEKPKGFNGPMQTPQPDVTNISDYAGFGTIDTLNATRAMIATLPEELSVAEPQRTGMAIGNFSPDTRFQRQFNGITPHQLNYKKNQPELSLYPEGYSILGKNFVPQPLTQNVVTQKTVSGASTNSSDFNTLPTWGRYAGPIGDALIAGYNAMQTPTTFTLPQQNVQQVSGHLGLINPEYKPIDANQYVSNLQAANAQAMRGVNNSGAGASTGALLLANGYNNGKNVGNLVNQIALQNAQLRNANIQQRNANAAQQAQFNLGIFQANANAKAMIGRYASTLPYALQAQQLNDASETAKFASVSPLITSGLQSLQNMGKENLYYNMANNNPSLAYGATKEGSTVHKQKCGGKIKRNK